MQHREFIYIVTGPLSHPGIHGYAHILVAIFFLLQRRFAFDSTWYCELSLKMEYDLSAHIAGALVWSLGAVSLYARALRIKFRAVSLFQSNKPNS